MRNADRHLMLTAASLLRDGRVFTSARRRSSRQTKHCGRRCRKETGASGPPPPSPSLPPPHACRSPYPATNAQAHLVPAGLASYSQRCCCCCWVRCMQTHHVGGGGGRESARRGSHRRTRPCVFGPTPPCQGSRGLSLYPAWPQRKNVTPTYIKSSNRKIQNSKIPSPPSPGPPGRVYLLDLTPGGVHSGRFLFWCPGGVALPASVASDVTCAPLSSAQSYKLQDRRKLNGSTFCAS